MGLSRLVVRILPQDDHLNFVEGSSVEGGKYVASLGVTNVLLAFGDEESFELLKVGCLELRAKYFEP